MKFADESLPETLLQSPAPSALPIAETEGDPVPSVHTALITPKPDNFEHMLARIKDFHSKLDMEELKGKSIEMFVCNICFEIYARRDLLREHYMTVSAIPSTWIQEELINSSFQTHDYVSIESETEENETEAKDAQATAITTKVVEIVQEEAQTSQQAIVKEEIDSDWQQPISLIALRKKLNKVFTFKYDPRSTAFTMRVKCE